MCTTLSIARVCEQEGRPSLPFLLTFFFFLYVRVYCSLGSAAPNRCESSLGAGNLKEFEFPRVNEKLSTELCLTGRPAWQLIIRAVRHSGLTSHAFVTDKFRKIPVC